MKLSPREEQAAPRGFEAFKQTGQKPLGLTRAVEQRGSHLAGAAVLGVSLEEFELKPQRFGEHQAAPNWISLLTGLSRTTVAERLKDVVAPEECV